MNPQYLEIVSAVDAEFQRNLRLHGHRMRCGHGCTDCCHHRFRITAVEASHLVAGLPSLAPAVRELVVSRAAAYQDQSADRQPCPALQDGACLLYHHRPLICRKFGMPIFNPDKPERIFACELNFRAGDEIRDPDLIRIQTEIHQTWATLRDSARLTVAEAILNAVITPE